jgi:tRNA(Ile)-lysidine synthase
MLGCTRQDVEAFLEEWCLPHIEDSSNAGDAFLRNRLRHHVMPLLKAENPRLAENVSAMALRLRQDEACLCALASREALSCEALRNSHPALRSRALEDFLKKSGVREPEAAHIAQAEALVFSEKPSAFARFPGGVTIARSYDTLAVRREQEALPPTPLPCPGSVYLPQEHLKITCSYAQAIENSPHCFTVLPQGALILRPRAAGDSMRLPGGSKPLKKLFIDQKIPAAQRARIPVIADELGVVGVFGIGVNMDRAARQLPAVRIQIEEK